MEEIYKWYRVDNEIGFRNYVDWVIAKCVSNLSVEGKIDPLKCNIHEHYGERSKGEVGYVLLVLQRCRYFAP